MKYEHGLFIYNGTAGNEHTEQKLSQTLPVLAKAIKKLTVIQTETIEEAKATFEAYAEDVDIMILLGGDGTLHECVNTIAPLGKRPVVAILPGGTCNDFSRALGMPQNLTQAARAIANGEVTDVDVGKTDGRYFLNFWGVGLVSDTSLNIDEDQKKNLGVLSYFMSTLRTVNQATPFKYKIDADNKQHEGEGVLILVLNGRFIGTRELPLPTVSLDDGKLDVLVIKNSTLASFRELLSMNNPETNSQQLTELTHFQATSIKVSTSEEKAIDMDGEIDGTTPDEITILPHHIPMVKNPSGV
ncbi:YegS/Rv2252/BmrU family lipid kinase [Lentibacillus amyloliquefaciens]|uniref:Diacylglycerol kinase n=1 Tax=Lentibacillus amyloliquefaciens TaxID=1472767 RepID=A0A0U4FN44_9BACI|nr:YegS/Rv2252/BmrU family lipid kinase [Lentibacillus amyloliquefaciens]ALX49156.1 diacylglycerol kinase [Lentibacillus amyloliquefaciens]